jgi:hypothetical protein
MELSRCLASYLALLYTTNRPTGGNNSFTVSKGVIHKAVEPAQQTSLKLFRTEILTCQLPADRKSLPGA